MTQAISDRQRMCAAAAHVDCMHPWQTLCYSHDAASCSECALLCVPVTVDLFSLLLALASGTLTRAFLEGGLPRGQVSLSA